MDLERYRPEHRPAIANEHDDVVLDELTEIAQEVLPQAETIIRQTADPGWKNWLRRIDRFFSEVPRDAQPPTPELVAEFTAADFPHQYNIF